MGTGRDVESQEVKPCILVTKTAEYYINRKLLKNVHAVLCIKKFLLENVHIPKPCKFKYALKLPHFA